MKKITLLLFLIATAVKSQDILTPPSEFYIPGSGTEIKTLDFENVNLKSNDFQYSPSWAGTGFGLSGSQRGAPEHVKVVDNPQIVSGSGSQVLEFYSYDRGVNPTSSFYVTNPSALNSSMYSTSDGELQDDFFMYGGDWEPSDTPSTMMHVYIPNNNNFQFTSIRMPSLIVYGGNPNKNTYPAIWLRKTYFQIRCPGYGAGQDYRIDITAENFPEYDFSNNEVIGKWFTLGLSVTTEGVIQYYAKDSYTTSFSAEDLIAESEIVNNYLGRTNYNVFSKHDAVIMTSNGNETGSPTLFDNLIYTHGTTVETTLGLDEELEGNDLSLLDPADVQSVTIYTTLGQKLNTYNTYNVGIITGLSEGFYILRVTLKNGRVINKKIYKS
jgi:hypothetical protein